MTMSAKERTIFQWAHDSDDLAAMDEPERKRMIAQLRGVLDRHEEMNAAPEPAAEEPVTEEPVIVDLDDVEPAAPARARARSVGVYGDF